MLFKNALKVASATALWMVALVGANSAMAQTPPPTFSAETLMGAGPAYAIEVEGTNTLSAPLNVNAATQFELQEAATGDGAVWIRVAASGVLRLATQPSVQIGTVPVGSPAGTAATLQGALADGEPTTAGSAYIYPVTARPGGDTVTPVNITAVIPDNTDATASGGADLLVTGIGAGSVQVSVYGNKRDANFGSGTPFQTGSTTLLNVARSVSVMPKAGPKNSALATTRFTVIEGNQTSTRPYEINLGGFDVAVNGMHLTAATGQTLAFGVDNGTPGDTSDDVGSLWAQTGVNGGTRFYGDGGWGFASGFRLQSAADGCSGNGPDGSAPGPQEGNGPGITSSPLSEENPTVDVVAGIKEMPWYLCVTISNDNDVTIPSGVYFVDVNLERKRAENDRAFPPAAATGLQVGTIVHDGTTVHLPYVTSHDGYTQRIVIVNRNKVDVSFALTFRAEGDGEIDGMNPYEGTAIADQATVIKVADVVTLTNPTRAAATLTLAAKKGTIDVATTQVNKGDGATDTVVFMPQ